METVTKVAKSLTQNASKDYQDETTQKLFLHVFENLDSFRDYLDPESNTPTYERSEKLRYSLFRLGQKSFYQDKSVEELPHELALIDALQIRNASNQNRGAPLKTSVYKSMTREQIHELLPLTLLEDAQIATESVEKVSVIRSAVLGLTKRQQAVYGLLAQGLTRSQIANELGITPKAVKERVAKANLENRCDILLGYSGGY